MGKTVIVIPAFNEENTISAVATGAGKYGKVVVVDDCSTDATAQMAEKAGAYILKNAKNGGYGASLNAGVAEAERLGADIIVVMDADGQHNPDDIPAMVAQIVSGKADVVVGKRPQTARISESMYKFFSRRKANIEDPLCGFKAFTADAYRKVGFYESVNSIGTEFAFAAAKRGLRISNVPISLSKRADEPRFGMGSRLRGELLIFQGMLRVLAKYGV